MHQIRVKFITAIKLFSLACITAVVAACGGGGSQAQDPTVVEMPIAYVKRPTPTVNGNPVSIDVTDPEVFFPGAHLLVKSRATLDAQVTDVSDAIIGDTGDVRDPSFSDDGTKLLFSLHKPNPNGGNETWNIYEYDLTKPLSQVAGQENPRMLISSTFANGGDDIQPHYMSGNRVVFSSTRANTTQGIISDENTATSVFVPTIEEIDSKRHAFNIHIMPEPAPGSYDQQTDISQISFNMSDDLYPSLIRNIPGLEGRIMFARWEHYPGLNAQMNQLSLYSMNPDGTDVQILYGHNSHSGPNNTTIQFTQPRETSLGNVSVVARSFTGTFDGGQPMQINVGNFVDNTVPVSGTSSGQAQTITTNVPVLATPGISPGGRFNSIFPLLDGTNRSLVSYSICFVNLTDNATNVTQVLGCNDNTVKSADPTKYTITEAPPRYGIFIYNASDNTTMPITLPEPGFDYTNITAAMELSPTLPIVGKDLSGFAILDIRSVYDMDGTFDASHLKFTTANQAKANAFNDLCTVPNITPLACDRLKIKFISDPANATFDPVNHPDLIERPAYFLRIIKGSYLPDSTLRNIRRSSFGVSRFRLMRQIVGYAPINPDGSVRVQVPANVPLSFSIVDKNGRRLSNPANDQNQYEHRAWITARPGETVSCNGCHDPASSVPHGRKAAQLQSINVGATASGYYVFPNCSGITVSNFGDTMADAWSLKTINNTQMLIPSPDINFVDVWTDPASRAVDTSFSYSYTPLLNNNEISANMATKCTPWTENCRVMINYETDIQPIWTAPRTDAAGNSQVCTNCHAAPNVNNTPPAADLDLQAMHLADSRHPDYNVSYANLLTTHEKENSDGTFQTTTVTDANGNTTTVNVTTDVHSMISGRAGATASSFFTKFTPPFPGPTQHCTNDVNGVCQSWLTPDELRLLSEWVDIGAQYYNNPNIAPTN